MSAEAQATLRQLWEKLHFSTVSRAIAREPEDVQSIELRRPIGTYPNGTPMFNHSEYTPYRRLDDVPESERWRMRASWRHYYGFTTDGIYFQKDGYNELDLGISLTLDFGAWLNHTGGWNRPSEGQLICGEVIETPKGRRFKKWFPCDEAFRLLVTIVREGTDFSEDELGRRLLTDDYPDMYWAIIRLVMFDNVQAFVNNQRYINEFWARREYDEGTPDWAKHPAAGMAHGRHGFKCQEGGMFLPKDTPEYLHLISHRLNQPQWWQEFLRLTKEQGVRHYHPAMGGVCEACEHENYARGEFWDPEEGWYDSQFPYSEPAEQVRRLNQ